MSARSSASQDLVPIGPIFDGEYSIGVCCREVHTHTSTCIRPRAPIKDDLMFTNAQGAEGEISLADRHSVPIGMLEVQIDGMTAGQTLASSSVLCEPASEMIAKVLAREASVLEFARQPENVQADRWLARQINASIKEDTEAGKLFHFGSRTSMVRALCE